MHDLAVQLAPMLAAEKSHVPFYIAGGLLVLWALTVSLGLGLRNPDFPGSLGGQRVVSAITAVLVIAALTTAVVTSGGAKTASASASTSGASSGQATSSGESPASSGASSTSTGASSTSSGASSTSTGGAPSTPTATTGTPAPSSSPAAEASTSVKLAANPAGQLAYDTKQLSAKAGTVTIEMTNMSPIEHDVAVAEGGKVLGQTPVFTGGSKKLTLKLKPGKYTFFCTVPGHRQAGMEGTLTVS